LLYGVYEAEFDATTFKDGTLPGTIVDGEYDISFKITPGRGDAGSVRVSEEYNPANTWRPELQQKGVQPTIEDLRVVLNGGGTADVAPSYVAVSPTGTDGSQTPQTTETAARNNPFKTIEMAKRALGNAGTSAINNGVIVLETGDYRWGADQAQQYASARWLTIRAATGVAQDDVRITDVGFTLRFNNAAVLTDAFEITNDSSTDDLEWRWAGDDFRLRRGSDNIRINRDAVGDLTGLRDAINNQTAVPDVSAALSGNTGSWLPGRGKGHFVSISDWETITPTATRVIQGLPVLYARVESGSGGQLIIHENGNTLNFSFAQYPTIADLVGILMLQGLNLSVESIYPDELTTKLLASNNNNVPSQEDIAFLLSPLSSFKHGYIRLANLSIYNTQLSAGGAFINHLWLRQVHMSDATKRDLMDGSTAGYARTVGFNGGIWATRPEFERAQKCMEGWVYVRDLLCSDIGGDVGKQVSAAINWEGHDIFPNPYDAVHSDHFQWSYSAPEAPPTLSENILALNFDFRDNCHGQPFFFDPRFNINFPNVRHIFRGVALINFRSNNLEAQQFEGDCDHILIWYCSCFQGGEDRAILLTGFKNNGPASTYHNASIRGTACERLSITAQSNDGNVKGDIPSLYSILGNCQIVALLTEELNGDAVDYSSFATQDVEHGGTLQDNQTDSLFSDFESPGGEWKPASGGPLVNRVVSTDVVVRFDALGDERDNPIALTNVGAVNDP
ncbi:MAG: hypothetical protein ACR2GY_13780, partial [Phycisphaerales bacterium]